MLDLPRHRDNGISARVSRDYVDLRAGPPRMSQPWNTNNTVIISSSTSTFITTHNCTTMSHTQPTYVTEETYQSHRSRQDTDIRREFGRQAALIEKGNKQLQVDLTTTFNNKLSNVNGTLSGRVGELSHEVQELKNEVHQVKSGLLDFGVRLERMEKVRMNGTKSRLYDKIEMFGKIVPGVGYQMPLYAPKNAGEFWKLKRDPTANNSQYHFMRNV